MKQRKIALGPGAASLILIVVVLSLCMLAMLTLISAKNDYSLSTRSAQMIEQVYLLSANTERKLAELDGILVDCAKEHPETEEYLSAVEENLPEGMEIEEDLVSWYEVLDNRSMECTVRLLPPGEGKRTEWVAHKLIVEEPGVEEWD